MVFEALFQEVIEHTHRMKEGRHATGLECDRSPFDVCANVFRQLVKSTQPFSGEKSNHGIRGLLSLARMDQFANIPGSQTDVVHRVAKLLQRCSVRGGFQLEPLYQSSQLGRQASGIG